jgi:hypothetical protein
MRQLIHYLFDILDFFLACILLDRFVIMFVSCITKLDSYGRLQYFRLMKFAASDVYWSVFSPRRMSFECCLV